MSRETARTPRQVFGAMLRYYRERAGLGRPELARQISKSVSLIQAIELGQRAPTAEVTEDLERVLPSDGALTRLREEIGDSLGYGAYPSWFEDWLASEREAKKLRTFEPMLVPGLLQTEDYARAVFSARFGITDEEINEQVAARLKRQEILAREEPPALWVILDEAVLRRPVGGRYVMREQVNHLIEAAKRPHVSVQVISSSVGAHRGLWAGAFVVADFEDAPTVGYQETACQGQFVDRREDVGTLADCWDMLVREALPWAASQALLEDAAKSWISAT
ncbi:MAG: helix-turn-helix transcriptional regulator [Streptosporangiaceae bacterium]